MAVRFGTARCEFPGAWSRSYTGDAIKDFVQGLVITEARRGLTAIDGYGLLNARIMLDERYTGRLLLGSRR